VESTENLNPVIKISFNDRNTLHELLDLVLVQLKEKLEILQWLIQLFVLISFLIVVTIEQLNECFVKQPNDLHVIHPQALFQR
jgi:hypothetical protein